MDYSLADSSVHGVFQARILEWLAISFSRRSSRPRDWTQVSCIVGRHFTVWATRKVLFITSCQIDGETMETVTDFIFLGSKITADCYCSHEIKRCLLLGRKAMTNLDSLLKSRNITLPTKVHIVKAMVFPVVMYGCESWTIKKAECWRRRFRTVVLEKILESPLDSK